MRVSLTMITSKNYLMVRTSRIHQKNPLVPASYGREPFLDSNLIETLGFYACNESAGIPKH